MSIAILDSSVETQCHEAASFAKINLTLEILGRRDDAFHELRSLVVGIELHDTLRARLGPGKITLRCTDPTLPKEENLALRAARCLAGHVPGAFGLDLELEKRIPVGAGLGGGSSNAATTLWLGSELAKLGWDRNRLARLGGTLGSDVPLFFFLPSALMRGRGDIVEAVSLRWSGWVLLVSPGWGVSTKAVYEAFRPSDMARQACPPPEELCAATSAAELTPMLVNHLEPAVFRVSPAVGRLRDELHRRGWGPLRVSGAGSTLYRLFDEKDAASRVAEEMRRARENMTIVVTQAPAGGLLRKQSGATHGNHGCIHPAGEPADGSAPSLL